MLSEPKGNSNRCNAVESVARGASVKLLRGGRSACPELISAQSPQDVYAPLRALADSDGYYFLMGVGLERLTLIYLSEQMSGRKLFRRWAKNINGEIELVETGGCSEGVGKLGAAEASTHSVSTPDLIR